MTHSFNVNLAVALGVNEAIIFEFIHYCVKANKMYNRGFKDGKYWLIYSIDNFCNTYGYMDVSEIINSLADLESRELILTKDITITDDKRVTMYTLTDKGQSLYDDLC